VQLCYVATSHIYIMYVYFQIIIGHISILYIHTAYFNVQAITNYTDAPLLYHCCWASVTVLYNTGANITDLHTLSHFWLVAGTGH
jgi:hypothetical protein